MRVANRVILIACSASVIGASTAAACSPQDYMSPEEWQALSPEQRAENSAQHTHEADTSVAPVAPPADPPATRDAAPQAEQPAGDAGGEKVAPPPVREAAPVIPALDGSSHRRPATERPATTEAQTTPGADASTAGSPAPAQATNAAPVAAARTTVVAVEQLTRMSSGSDASKRAAAQRAAAQRAARRAEERAADRRQAARERRDAAAPAADTRRDAQTSTRTPVRADEAPVAPVRPDDDGRLTALAAVMVALSGLAVVIIRVFRPEAPAPATSTQVHTPRPPSTTSADPVEAELQAIIAAHINRLAEPHPAQEAGTGDGSSTATNSA